MKTKQEKIEAAMKQFNQKIEEGYRVDWTKTKQKKGKTIIALEK